MASPEIPPGALGLRAMRRLDRWLGLPLCLLADLALRLAARLAPRRGAAPARGPVLYVALAEMGSIVLAAPAIRQGARHHGGPPLFLTLAPTREVFDLLGADFAREVFVLRNSGLAALCADLWAFARWARRRGIAVAIDLDPGARCSALLALLSGAPRRAGFAGPEQPYRGRLYTHEVACPPARHMGENFAALVQAPFAGDADLPPKVVALPATPGATRPRPPHPAPRAASRLVLIHANASDPLPQRRWPAARYAQLCRRLLAAWPDMRILIIGAAAEAPAAAALCAEVGDARCASSAGRLSLAELPALFAGAALLVSSDSGPAHFAAHAGLPVVALFGPETPRRYGPPGATALYAGLPCSPCLSPRSQRASSCRDARCMAAIELDTVFAAVAELLAPVAAARAARA